MSDAIPVQCEEPGHRRAATAWHEAGHVIVARAQNVFCACVTIKPGPDSDGTTFYDSKSYLSRDGHIRMKNHVSGGLAQRMFCPACTTVFCTQSDDVSAAQTMNRAFTRNVKEHPQIRSRAEFYATRLLHKNAQSLRALASLILQRETLQRRELDAFFRKHPITGIELHDCRAFGDISAQLRSRRRLS